MQPPTLPQINTFHALDDPNNCKLSTFMGNHVIDVTRSLVTKLNCYFHDLSTYKAHKSIHLILLLFHVTSQKPLDVNTYSIYFKSTPSFHWPIPIIVKFHLFWTLMSSISLVLLATKFSCKFIISFVSF